MQRHTSLSYCLRSTPLVNFLHAKDVFHIFGTCRQHHDIRFSDRNVRVLDVSGFQGNRLSDFCSKVDTDHLPATLEKLVCKGCPNLTKIDIALPEALKVLEVDSCDILESIRAPLPNDLQVFKCTNCEELQAHPDPLPDGLQTYAYESNASSEIGMLPEPLPSALVELKCRGLSGDVIQNVPTTWPSNLRVLDLAFSTSLNDKLINLPTSLEVLNLCMCDGMPQLPANLSALTNLRSLDITGCDEIEHIADGVLPENLEHLVCNSMYKLVSFPRKLPPKLLTFECEYCPELKTFPEDLPLTLRRFVFSSNYHGQPLSIPPIPVGTTVHHSIDEGTG